jgi:hypothetical protein
MPHPQPLTCGWEAQDSVQHFALQGKVLTFLPSQTSSDSLCHAAWSNGKEGMGGSMATAAAATLGHDQGSQSTETSEAQGQAQDPCCYETSCCGGHFVT